MTPATTTLRLALAALAGALCEASGVALTATATWLVCRAAEQPPLAALTLAVVAVRALAVARGGLRYAERLAGHDAALRVMERVRARFFDVLVPLAPSGLPAFRRGDLLTRLVSDVDAVQETLLRVVLPALTALLIGGGASVWMATQLPETALALLVGLVAGCVVLPVVGAIALDRVHRRLVTARRDLASRVVDAVAGAEDLALAGVDDPVPAQATERLERTVALRGALLTAAGTFVQLATTAAVALLAVRAQADGRADAVTVAVLTLTALVVLETAAPVQAAGERLGQLGTALRRLRTVLRARPPVPEPAVPQPVRPGPVRLEFAGATVVPPGARRAALASFDLCVPPGRKVAIVGPSGSGKSTVIGAALGFVPLTAGAVTLDGVPVQRIRGEELRPRLLAGLTQEHYVLAGTVRSHLLLARPGASEAELWSALARAGADTWVRALPRALDTRVLDDAADLAGGQRQRIALAAALLADPAVLVLDEPTESLDPVTARALLRDLLSPSDGRTVLVVSHQLLGMEEADEIVVLHSGRAVQRGTHARLLAEPGHYRDQYEAERAAAAATAVR